MRHLPACLSAAAVVISALASAPSLAQESPASGDPVAAFAQRNAATPVVLDGVVLAGPVVLAPRPPEDIPPSLHEQIRLLKARLDNAYPDASDARKLHFIADYLDISFRRLWNAYHPGRPDMRPDARPVDVRPADRIRPDDRVRPADPQRVRPADTRPVRPVTVRPAQVARPTRPRG